MNSECRGRGADASVSLVWEDALVTGQRGSQGGGASFHLSLSRAAPPTGGINWLTFQLTDMRVVFSFSSNWARNHMCV